LTQRVPAQTAALDDLSAAMKAEMLLATTPWRR
jgi:hypothetical protein